jgi:hypothetical protein
MKSLVPHHSRFTQQQMGPSATATETVMRQLYKRRTN